MAASKRSIRKKKTIRPKRPVHRQKWISPVGWYVASYIERLEFGTEDRSNLNRRCTAWENTILVRAKNPEQAYQKVWKFASINNKKWEKTSTGRKRWVLEGLTMLSPVDEEIQDCCEIIWREYANRSVSSIKARIKSKSELEVFS